jgi:DNA-binding transcriptional ArsR family regulator
LKRPSASCLARRIDSTGRRPLRARLYRAEAEFFRMLGHPVCIRVLKLLQDGPSRCDLLAEIDIEPSSFSQ